MATQSCRTLPVFRTHIGRMENGHPGQELPQAIRFNSGEFQVIAPLARFQNFWYGRHLGFGMAKTTKIHLEGVRSMRDATRVLKTLSSMRGVRDAQVSEILATVEHDGCSDDDLLCAIERTGDYRAKILGSEVRHSITFKFMSSLIRNPPGESSRFKAFAKAGIEFKLRFRPSRPRVAHVSPIEPSRPRRARLETSDIGSQPAPTSGFYIINVILGAGFKVISGEHPIADDHRAGKHSWRVSQSFSGFGEPGFGDLAKERAGLIHEQ